MALYRNGDFYVYLTDQSPKGFDGVLFVAFEGTGPSDLKETVVAPSRVTGWQSIELTNEWCAALGLPPVEEEEEVEVEVEVERYRETIKPIQVRVETRVETVYKYVEVCHRCETKKADTRHLKAALLPIGLAALAVMFLIGLYVRPDAVIAGSLAAILLRKRKF